MLSTEHLKIMKAASIILRVIVCAVQIAGSDKLSRVVY